MTFTRKLPIGIQDFETIRRENYVYVDKTQYIWNLVETGKRYFLSRPRRFGKSLLLSTLSAYFHGNRELFHGLAIEEKENARGDEAWLAYPVIYFSLSGGEYNDQDGLADRLSGTMERCAREYELSVSVDQLGRTLSVQFAGLIELLYKKTGRKVVVLVDEYDKPLLETMTVNPQQEERNRQLYKSFFSVLKDDDSYIEFVFFTGVTKFSKVSIFSDLNQLKDISLLEGFAGICGITDQEMNAAFHSEIQEMAKVQGMTEEECRLQLARTYDGYHFSTEGPGVYNPFSLLNALSDQKFGKYWFETGTPTFLIRKLQDSSFRVEQFVDGVECTETQLTDYRTENADPVPLFYQSGYLTICGYDKEFDLYTLRFPNEEVKYGFLNSLVPYVLGERDEEHPYSLKAIVLALRDGDTDNLEKQLYSVFASVPYNEGAAGKAEKYEAFWRGQIYLIFSLLGQYVSCEQHTSQGRCDCVIETADYIYLLEFKVDKSAEEALRQIEEKDYAGRFKADERKVIRIGVNFSSEKRNISEWRES